MESALVDWLANVGTVAFRWSLLAFVVVNGAAVASVVLTKDRALVNRWTGRVLAANLVLAGTGIGIPLLTSVTRLAVAAVLPTTARLVPTVISDDGASLQVELRAKD